MIAIIVIVVLLVLAALLIVRCLLDLGLNWNVPRIFVSSDINPRNISPASPMESRKVFLTALGFRFFIVAVGMIAMMIFSTNELTFQDCFQQLCQKWDARHYVQLIEKGYAGYTENGQHLFLVFFPGYVWAVRLLRLVIPNTLAAGVLLSCVCSAGGYLYVYKIARECYSADIAKDSLLYLSLFPFSFFSGLIMTEGLFLLTTAGACYYAIKEKWFFFALFGFSAALTRMTGILVIFPAIMELLSQKSSSVIPSRGSFRIAWKKAVKLPLVFFPILGTGVYLLLNYYIDGDPFAFVIHQKHWNQGFLWIPNVIEYIADYFQGNLSNSLGWSIWFPSLTLFTLFVILLLWAVRQSAHRSSLLTYAVIYFVAAYSLSWLLSAGRYLSCCFPLFLFLAKFTENKSTLRTMILGTESIFLGIYFCGYINGAQIM